MGTSRFEVLKIEFIFEPNWTVCAVTCGAPSEGELGVQGRHVKHFEPHRSAIDILQNELKACDFLLWPLSSEGA